MRVLVLILFFAFAHKSLAQESDEDTLRIPTRKSKFLTGFYIGPYFANKYSAAIYNGYGFDRSGAQNTFSNSLMYQKIINEYGGGYQNTVDQIAVAIGVDPGQWQFKEDDMPVNMHYLKSIMVGLNFKVPVYKKNGIILNVNATQLGVEGNFTIITLRPQTQPSNPGQNSNIKTFAITGREQRLLFELGYQHIFGNDEKINFMAELGFVGTVAKYERNTIYINNLQIDLTAYWNQAYYPSNGPAARPVGFGVGAFAGLGANVNFNPKFTLQFLYTLSHEKVNIGIRPALKLQHSVGLRIYYNF